MHTMKASFPIFNILVSVTTLLQCSVVYTGYYFFSTHECQREKKKMSCVPRTANNCCLIRALSPKCTAIVSSTIVPCPSVLVAYGPSQCPLKCKRIMPNVQNPQPRIAPRSQFKGGLHREEKVFLLIDLQHNWSDFCFVYFKKKLGFIARRNCRLLRVEYSKIIITAKQMEIIFSMISVSAGV